MSLKAKLEAVIYAAEEPVTLVQLAALFATEAIEWKEAPKAAFLGLEEPAESSTEEGEASTDAPEAGEDFPDPRYPVEQTDETGARDTEPDETSLNGTRSNETDPDTAEPSIEGEDTESSPTAQFALNGGASESESEMKRLARLRDREIRETLRQIISEIAQGYANDERGIEIREVAGGYRMATKPECHDAVRAFVKSLKPPLKLSLPALETLAVIAYKQPVTAPEVGEIRGVDSGGVLGSLISRKLITTAGRKQVIGRPILYKTTREFLLRFGLKDLSELPSMEEFEKMAAIELEEPETTNENEQNEDATSHAAEDSRHPEFEEDADEDATDEGINEDPAAMAESEASLTPIETEGISPAEPAETEAIPHEGQ